MKIYTKTGDKGQTSLLRGGRVPKHHPRVETYGTFDELNSLLGVARSHGDDGEIDAILSRLQTDLHILCSDISADPEHTDEEVKVPRVSEERVLRLESEIDEMTSQMPQLTNFILPGGSQAGAAVHHARTVCRRGERRLGELVEAGGQVSEPVVRYVNRLSDHLFTLARYTNFKSGEEESIWVGKEHT